MLSTTLLLLLLTLINVSDKKWQKNVHEHALCRAGGPFAEEQKRYIEKQTAGTKVKRPDLDIDSPVKLYFD